VVGVIFYAPLWFETEFQRHLHVVLRIVHSLSGRVSGEPREGAAEILFQIGVEHGNYPHLCLGSE
jgi:hypothetical protein